MEGTGRGEKGGDGVWEPRGGEAKRPHPFTPPLIHISGYAPVDGVSYSPSIVTMAVSLTV